MFELSKVTEAFEVVQRNMNSLIGPRNYDEVAVMVRDPLSAHVFCEKAEKEGFGRKFNRSSDTVTTWPIITEYDVTYRFLELKDHKYRIEVMNFNRGVSPAHIPAHERLNHGELATVVHVSYKPPGHGGIDNYQAEKKILENRGLLFVQECRSTYGIFSYWLHPDLPDGVYLKPRVNLRDPADPLQKITEEQFLTAAERAVDEMRVRSERVETDTLSQSLDITDRWYPR